MSQKLALDLVSSILARAQAGENFMALAEELGLSEALSAATEIPTVVLEINSGCVNAVRSNTEMRVIILDEDTEGGDEGSIFEVGGNEVYVHNYHLESTNDQDSDGINHAFVTKVVDELFGQGI